MCKGPEVDQGQVSQVHIITCGRVEGADEAWKKKVGKSSQGEGGSETKGYGP